MTWRGTTIAAALALAMALGAAAPAEAGFWGDFKQGLGTAVDDAQRDGAEAIDSITGGGGEAAPAAAPQAAVAPVGRPPGGGVPAADGSKQLSKQPGK